MGSRNLSERQNAWEKLDKMLDEHGLSWNDLPAILAAVDARDGADVANDTATDGASPPGAASVPNLLDLVMRLIEEHVAVTPAERMAIALWTLHTYVFERFSVAPRLAALPRQPNAGRRPCRSCSKSWFETSSSRRRDRELRSTTRFTKIRTAHC